MKLSSQFRAPVLAAGLLAAATFSAAPNPVNAKEKDKDRDDKKGRPTQKSKDVPRSKANSNDARFKVSSSRESQRPSSTSKPAQSIQRQSRPSAPQVQVQTRSSSKPQPQPQPQITRDYDRSNDRDHERSRSSYHSHPRSGFVLSFGNGYAGRGYYYGPPNTTYFHERPEVRYYSTREAAPREYYVTDPYCSDDYGYGTVEGMAVQRALTRLGYYSGVIDGDIGPVSSRAILNYQSNNGLRPTGTINPQLLQSLGIN